MNPILPTLATNLRTILEGHERGIVTSSERDQEIALQERAALEAVERYGEGAEDAKAVVRDLVSKARGATERYGYEEIEDYADGAISRLVESRKKPMPSAQEAATDIFGELLDRLRTIGPAVHRRVLGEEILGLLKRYPDLRKRLSGQDLAFLLAIRQEVDQHYAQEQTTDALARLPEAIAAHLAPLASPVIHNHMPKQDPPVFNAAPITVTIPPFPEIPPYPPLPAFPEIPASVVHYHAAEQLPTPVVHQGIKAEDLEKLVEGMTKPRHRVIERDANGDIARVIETGAQ